MKSESKYIYDSLNHLEKKETNNKKVEGYKYDKDGNLITIEKPGNTKTFTYTIDNKLKDTYVNGSLTESATYDASGLKVTSTLKKEYNVTVTDITVNKEETKGKTRRYTTPYEEDNSYTETHIETIPGSEGYEYTEFVAEHEDEDMQWLADFVGVIAPAFSDSWHQYADSLTTEEYRTVSVEGTESTKKTTEVLHEDSVSGSDTYVKRTPGSVKETQEESSHTETRTYYEKSYLVYDMTLSNPQVLSEESAPGTSRVNYTYAGEERLASSSLGSYVYDGRGSVKKVVNGSAVVRDYDYDPYGNITKGAPAQERMYGYNGEEYTPQTGLIYLRARHYNPSTATFTSEDTYAGDKANPVTRNRYSYANNNPMMYKDPSGHRAVYLDVNNNPVIVNSKPSKTTVKATKTAAAAVAAAVSAAKGVGAAVNKKTTTKTVTNPAKAEVQAATTITYHPQQNVTVTVSGSPGAQTVTYKVNGKKYYYPAKILNPSVERIKSIVHGTYSSNTNKDSKTSVGENTQKSTMWWSTDSQIRSMLGLKTGPTSWGNPSTQEILTKVLIKEAAGYATGKLNEKVATLKRHSESTKKINYGAEIALAELVSGDPRGALVAIAWSVASIYGEIKGGFDYYFGDEKNNPDGFWGAVYDGEAKYGLEAELSMMLLIKSDDFLQAHLTQVVAGEAAAGGMSLMPISTLPSIDVATPALATMLTVIKEPESVPTNSPNIETLSSGYLRHVNGSIGEIQGFYHAINDLEHIPIQSPGKVTAPGPDYITYDGKSIYAWDAKYSSTGKYPNSARGFGSESWMKEILEAISKIKDPVLRGQMMDAYNNNRIIWEIFRWP